MLITLNTVELGILFSQHPLTEGEGGFQSLLVRLQRNTDRRTGELCLAEQDLERIPRYAFDYGNGGWENMLRDIFQRSLGPSLGR